MKTSKKSFVGKSALSLAVTTFPSFYVITISIFRDSTNLRSRVAGIEQVTFTPTFRADWAHIESFGTYFYSAAAFTDVLGLWKVWHCGYEASGESIFYTRIVPDGK